MSRSVELRTVMPRANGHYLYQGPSEIDGAQIVVIVPGLRDGSSNDKTGRMLQTWILRADRAPMEALRDGADESVCGDCIHRVVNGAGSCYVNVAQGPTAVYRAFVNGSYPASSPEEVARLIEGRLIRLGSYGDPAAVPVRVWEALLARAAGHTGETHQWRRARAQAYRRILMASVDSEPQGDRARAMGWRTFRVKSACEPKVRGEMACPASQEAGRRLTCETCGVCDGAQDRPSRASGVMNVHGLAWKAARYALAQKAIRHKKRFRVGAG